MAIKDFALPLLGLGLLWWRSRNQSGTQPPSTQGGFSFVGVAQRMGQTAQMGAIVADGQTFSAGKIHFQGEITNNWNIAQTVAFDIKLLVNGQIVRGNLSGNQTMNPGQVMTVDVAVDVFDTDPLGPFSAVFEVLVDGEVADTITSTTLGTIEVTPEGNISVVGDFSVSSDGGQQPPPTQVAITSPPAGADVPMVFAVTWTAPQTAGEWLVVAFVRGSSTASLASALVSGAGRTVNLHILTPGPITVSLRYSDVPGAGVLDFVELAKRDVTILVPSTLRYRG